MRNGYFVCKGWEEEAPTGTTEQVDPTPMTEGTAKREQKGKKARETDSFFPFLHYASACYQC